MDRTKDSASGSCWVNPQMKKCVCRQADYLVKPMLVFWFLHCCVSYARI